MRIVAVLHDALEYTDVTIADLHNEGFSEVILATIESLTKQEVPDRL